MLFSNIALPALPQAVFDLPRAVFEIKVPLRRIDYI
jgi:hypothetical protein